MSKGDGSKKLEPVWGGEQLAFDFMGPEQYPVELVGETREGYGLFRRKEPHGGFAYYTDEIPPGLCVYDEGLTNLMSLFEALDHLGSGKTWWKHIGVVFGYDKD